MSLTLLTFETSQFDISGKDIKFIQPENILSKDITLETFHFDISGKDFNELHSQNILLISLT